MKRLCLIVGLVFLLCSSFIPRSAAQSNQLHRIYTKIPWAVGFNIRGTVTNVATIDGRIHFTFTGWFSLSQYPWGGTNQEVIKVDCEHGISAFVTPDWFVAMTTDWRGGSVQNDKGRLLQILQTAATRHSEIRAALTNPDLGFGTNGFAIKDAKVWRISDMDLH